MDEMQTGVADTVNSLMRSLNSYILQRKPPCFIFDFVMQPCTFADSFTYVYLVSFYSDLYLMFRLTELLSQTILRT